MWLERSLSQKLKSLKKKQTCLFKKLFQSTKKLSLTTQLVQTISNLDENTTDKNFLSNLFQELSKENS